MGFSDLSSAELGADRFAQLHHRVASLARRQSRGGEVEPHMGGDEIRRDAVTVGVEETQAVLPLGDAAIGGHAIPARRLGIVLPDIDAPYTAQARTLSDFPADFLPTFRRWFPRLAVDLMDERRPGVQRWLFLTAKHP